MVINFWTNYPCPKKIRLKKAHARKHEKKWSPGAHLLEIKLMRTDITCNPEKSLSCYHRAFVSSGMILAWGARDLEFDSRKFIPYLLIKKKSLSCYTINKEVELCIG